MPCGAFYTSDLAYIQKINTENTAEVCGTTECTQHTVGYSSGLLLRTCSGPTFVDKDFLELGLLNLFPTRQSATPQDISCKTRALKYGMSNLTKSLTTWTIHNSTSG